MVICACVRGACALVRVRVCVRGRAHACEWASECTCGCPSACMGACLCLILAQACVRGYECASVRGCVPRPLRA